MELFLLEEDDGNDMFITQSSYLDSSSNSNYGSILGNANDFKSPCVSIANPLSQDYSDISDDDFVNIPCSQVNTNDTANTTE